ncbi:MAG TPA: response regulator [Spirochaetota bacterium]|nr:response regulator [Spirochaetota bacterium]HOK91259.1 response regulator [Spirochaetota bacterium]HOQ13407.1 response regulator [Spirochaetota bacterium]HOV09103.1 response regulator [Spirochaetota bacterium]HPD77002.1 response regulator [Spirochaetota bacterium]
MKKIVIVEDDQVIRESLKEFLEINGYEVMAIESSIDLLQKISSFKPDILITDIIMPDKDGIEIIIETKKYLPNIRLIAISGGGRIDSESYLNTAKYLGADATLKKPFSHKELLDCILNLTK